jgi:hypothetical protein
MRDRRRTGNAPSVREQVILIGVTLLLCLVVLVLHAPDKWLAAIYCTVPTFAGMITYFRTRLALGPLWSGISDALLLHLGLLWLVFGVLLRGRTDASLLICIPAIFGEGFILYHAVRLVAAKVDRSW